MLPGNLYRVSIFDKFDIENDKKSKFYQGNSRPLFERLPSFKGANFFTFYVLWYCLLVSLYVL